MAEPVLALEGIETCYGLSQVLFGVSLAIAPGEMVTLMGRNGMGKTTTVRSIMGLTPARAGAIRFMGDEIRGLPSYKVAQRGIGLVPEGRQIFPNLSVRENLLATAVKRNGADWTLAKVYGLLPRLAERAATLTEWKQPGILNTLAAAYAEAGRFDAATNAAAQAIELAAAREILGQAVAKMAGSYPGMSMSYEPNFATGAVFAQASSPAQALLTLLDGLQPTGITTVFIDPYGLMAALGAISPANNILPVQILESGAFQNLGAVICPISDARPGTIIMRARLVFDDGNETRLDIKQGSLVPLPLRHGQSARIYLEALRGTIIDPRRRTGGGFKITGGVCGALIDARGRPLSLPDDPGKRRETLLRWSQVVETHRPA